LQKLGIWFCVRTFHSDEYSTDTAISSSCASLRLSVQRTLVAIVLKTTEAIGLIVTQSKLHGSLKTL